MSGDGGGAINAEGSIFDPDAAKIRTDEQRQRLDRAKTRMVNVTNDAALQKQVLQNVDPVLREERNRRSLKAASVGNQYFDNLTQPRPQASVSHPWWQFWKR